MMSFQIKLKTCIDQYVIQISTTRYSTTYAFSIEILNKQDDFTKASQVYNTEKCVELYNFIINFVNHSYKYEHDDLIFVIDDWEYHISAKNTISNMGSCAQALANKIYST